MLELVEQMAMGPKKREEKAEEGDGSCYDYGEFFRLTRYEVPKGVLENGRLVRFDNGLVIRYLGKVLVEDDGYRILFKAGLEVEVIMDRVETVEMAIE